MKRFRREDILRLTFQRYRKTGLTIAVPILVEGVIPTLEGPKKAYAGDYLGIGVKGEIWPIRKANFEAEKVKVQDLPNGLATYASTSIRHATRIDEAFFVEKAPREVAYISEPEGGYLVWNGKDGDEFAAWIVQRDIFEQSYESVEGAA
jgi:hypothetical protein